MSKPLALIVDDEPDIRELLGITLGRMDIDTAAAADLSAAKQELDARRFDLCLTDMRLPDGNGLDLVTWMQARHPSVPVAMITAHGNVEAAVEALKAGAFDFVSKPVELEHLRKLIATALKLRGTASETAAATRLLGDSPAIEQVREMIRKVARSQAPVHITGESGTGKELVARLIHESGPRASKPFVPINCGAIPSELMESEFFGHRKGSFTGAVADKTGLVQSAEGGTLFLDEVADLPLPMQVKLLRVIQEKRVRPVGSPAEVPVDVRILSATHKNLRALIAAGQFREDLYYRIDVIEVHAPTLRERPEDIPLLANHIIARLAKGMDIEPPALSDEALAALLAFDYPGNVRELENILERALTLCDGDIITDDCIAVRRTPRPEPGATAASTDLPLESKVADVERQAIQQALEATRYNKTAAAKRLGMTFRQLRYRIKKLGLEEID
ncbi:MAG TPA: sigma-54 dependent transcriptional regulator [Gammaproteobacteria bacterium]|jgi:two-component system response regulator PilR (NtrC family)|nr:sigma-54 dependent transcriptional regulator [Gammaproteobacteria bacterium]